ncbi:MAG: hypothetical protein U0K68_03590 [Agathobacter sp.]|nr:hypothetical protein [Agathobacter sp.]
MLETLLIALRLQVAYSTNGIQYYIRKIPLVKRLFWGKPYDNADFKQVFTVLGGIWELIKKFACKLIYILALAIIADKLTLFAHIPEEQIGNIFIQTYIFFAIIGGIINNHLWGVEERDYYAIFLLRMESRRYVLSQFGFYLIHSTVAYIVSLFTIGHWVCNLSLADGVILTLFFVSVKLIAAAFELKFDYRHIKNVNWGNIIATIILLALAAGLPLLHIVLPIWLMRSIMALCIVPAVFGIYKLLTYENYTYTYRRQIVEYRQVISEIDTSSSNEAQARQNAISDSVKVSSSKHGLAYLHDLFVKRHFKLLWKNSIIISAIVAVLFLGSGVLYLIDRSLFDSFHGDIISILPAMPFVMYLINRGLPYTQALYANCDHSMLTFSFYREPGTMLGLFVIRLVSIIKVNLLPAAVIGLGLDLLHFLTSKSQEPLDYIIILVSIVCLSIFFSVHYLVIYYLLQPYNAATEVKSPAYSLVKWLTYGVCYGTIQLEITSSMFGIGTIAFCVAYCIIACVLVYKLAPKTFHIKN